MTTTNPDKDLMNPKVGLGTQVDLNTLVRLRTYLSNNNTTMTAVVIEALNNWLDEAEGHKALAAARTRTRKKAPTQEK